MANCHGKNPNAQTESDVLTDADDVADAIATWLETERDVEADVDARVEVPVVDDVLFVRIRNADRLDRTTLDGLRSRGFDVAAITRDDDPRTVLRHDLEESPEVDA